MSQNRIEGPVPHQICSSLTQLKTLRLCANQITSLPHSLARLDKLESLSMGSVYGGNLLTSFPANCIQYMSALRELDLSHNKLCFLPADIGHPKSHLRQLSASDNKLEAIPKSIGHCRELRSLNLGRNQLTSLPTEIADLNQLDTLDLSENLLCVIPGDVADFLTKTTLLLTGNPFTRGYCDANRNPVSEIGGLGINYPTDEDRYAAMLKSLSRRAILNSAASTSSSAHTPTLSSLAAGRESPRLTPPGESGYEMDQDERLDYHLYYTRHALASRPPSRAESGQCGQIAFPSPSFESSKSPMVSPVVGLLPTTTPTPGFFPSLKELAARAVLHQGEPLPLEYIPEVVVEYLEPGARPCGFCRGPYVKEWVSSVRVKSYLGHPAVARRVRFCSAACWRTASEQLDAEEAGNIVPSAAAPGSTTGHLPPVVTTDGDSRGSSREEDLDVTMVDSTLSSPTTHSAPSSPLTTPMSPWTQGMRVCKGGQTYWPVIGRQRRGRTLSSGLSSPLSVSPSTKLSVDESASIAKTNVCSGGCLVRGVCEW
ncbi:hypothetical protein EDD21DRAFT_304791 [Dissophora ornata]|nr:hypothetical protein EDD21DRAFT_304791 [Dissophora ornata]